MCSEIVSVDLQLKRTSRRLSKLQIYLLYCQFVLFHISVLLRISFHGGLLFNVDIQVVGVTSWLSQCTKERLGYDSPHILHTV